MDGYGPRRDPTPEEKKPLSSVIFTEISNMTRKPKQISLCQNLKSFPTFHNPGGWRTREGKGEGGGGRSSGEDGVRGQGEEREEECRAVIKIGSGVNHRVGLNGKENRDKKKDVG